MKLQTDDYSCGPIALINAYIYLHGKYPRISTRTLTIECLTTENGTNRWDLDNNSILILKKPTYNIKKIMEMNAFILLYSFSKSNAHYVFVKKVDNENFHIYNYYDTENDSYINIVMDQESFLHKILRKNPRISNLDYPLAWTIN